MGDSQQIDLSPSTLTGQDREVAKEPWQILVTEFYLNFTESVINITPIKYVHVTLYMRVFVMVDG